MADTREASHLGEAPRGRAVAAYFFFFGLLCGTTTAAVVLSPMSLVAVSVSETFFFFPALAFFAAFLGRSTITAMGTPEVALTPVAVPSPQASRVQSPLQVAVTATDFFLTFCFAAVGATVSG